MNDDERAEQQTEREVTAAEARGRAEGRRQAAREIRAEMSKIAARAESSAGVETGAADSHPFMIAAEWAARIAEGTEPWPPRSSGETP